jgi:hypothetical protein
MPLPPNREASGLGKTPILSVYGSAFVSADVSSRKRIAGWKCTAANIRECTLYSALWTDSTSHCWKYYRDDLFVLHRDSLSARLFISGLITIDYEYIDWQWPLSCVLSLMMVFSAQLAKGEGARPPPLERENATVPTLSHVGPLPFSLMITYKSWSNFISFIY